MYPDDDQKPPVGEDLNKKAEVTLDCVWPNDKSTQSPIKVRSITRPDLVSSLAGLAYIQAPIILTVHRDFCSLQRTVPKIILR